MAKITAARAATLQENADKSWSTPRKWRVTVCGVCALRFDTEQKSWIMWNMETKSRHMIAGGDLDRLNAHWKGFCKNHNRAAA